MMRENEGGSYPGQQGLTQQLEGAPPVHYAQHENATHYSDGVPIPRGHLIAEAQRRYEEGRAQYAKAVAEGRDPYAAHHHHPHYYGHPSYGAAPSVPLGGVPGTAPPPPGGPTANGAVPALPGSAAAHAAARYGAHAMAPLGHPMQHGHPMPSHAHLLQPHGYPGYPGHAYPSIPPRDNPSPSVGHPGHHPGAPPEETPTGGAPSGAPPSGGPPTGAPPHGVPYHAAGAVPHPPGTAPSVPPPVVAHHSASVAPPHGHPPSAPTTHYVVEQSVRVAEQPRQEQWKLDIMAAAADFPVSKYAFDQMQNRRFPHYPLVKQGQATTDPENHAWLEMREMLVFLGAKQLQQQRQLEQKGVANANQYRLFDGEGIPVKYSTDYRKKRREERREEKESRALGERADQPLKNPGAFGTNLRKRGDGEEGPGGERPEKRRGDPAEKGDWRNQERPLREGPNRDGPLRTNRDGSNRDGDDKPVRRNRDDEKMNWRDRDPNQQRFQRTWRDKREDERNVGRYDLDDADNIAEMLQRAQTVNTVLGQESVSTSVGGIGQQASAKTDATNNEFQELKPKVETPPHQYLPPGQPAQNGLGQAPPVVPGQAPAQNAPVPSQIAAGQVAGPGQPPAQVAAGQHPPPPGQQPPYPAPPAQQHAMYPPPYGAAYGYPGYPPYHYGAPPVGGPPGTAPPCAYPCPPGQPSSYHVGGLPAAHPPSHPPGAPPSHPPAAPPTDRTRSSFHDRTGSSFHESPAPPLPSQSPPRDEFDTFSPGPKPYLHGVAMSPEVVPPPFPPTPVGQPPVMESWNLMEDNDIIEIAPDYKREEALEEEALAQEREEDEEEARLAAAEQARLAAEKVAQEQLAQEKFVQKQQLAKAQAQEQARMEAQNQAIREKRAIATQGQAIAAKEENPSTESEQHVDQKWSKDSDKEWTREWTQAEWDDWKNTDWQEDWKDWKNTDWKKDSEQNGRKIAEEKPVVVEEPPKTVIPVPASMSGQSKWGTTKFDPTPAAIPVQQAPVVVEAVQQAPVKVQEPVVEDNNIPTKFNEQKDERDNANVAATPVTEVSEDEAEDDDSKDDGEKLSKSQRKRQRMKLLKEAKGEAARIANLKPAINPNAPKAPVIQAHNSSALRRKYGHIIDATYQYPDSYYEEQYYEETASAAPKVDANKPVALKSKDTGAKTVVAKKTADPTVRLTPSTASVASKPTAPASSKPAGGNVWAQRAAQGIWENHSHLLAPAKTVVAKPVSAFQKAPAKAPAQNAPAPSTSSAPAPVSSAPTSSTPQNASSKPQNASNKPPAVEQKVNPAPQEKSLTSPVEPKALLMEFLQNDEFWPELEKERKKLAKKLFQIEQLEAVKASGGSLDAKQLEKIAEKESAQDKLHNATMSVKNIEADYVESTRRAIDLEEKRAEEEIIVEATKKSRSRRKKN